MGLKKLIMILLPVMLLGCGAEPVFEQVEDVYGGNLPPAAQVQVDMPESASVMAAAGDGSGQICFCDGYTLTVQTMAGGDLDRTIRALTGYGADSLAVLETLRDGTSCYTCAWTSAGERGDQIGRLVLLDDGTWHYVVTVMADAAQAGELAEQWDQILGSVTLQRTAP